MQKRKKPLVLVIMDGFGLNPDTLGNAIKAAKKPNLDRLFSKYPNTIIKCSGMDVGLPVGQMGNSEVGHTNIGAGRIVYQELTRISKSISDGSFFVNPEFIRAMDNCVANGTKLHLMGLLSDGGVHSHNTHLYALIEMAARRGLKDIYIHCFLDGRDVPPDSGAAYVRQLEGKLAEIGAGHIATVMGRYYAMDRDNRWDRVEKAYSAMVYGRGNAADNAVSAVLKSYQASEYDEFVKPCVILNDSGKPTATVSENDSVIFYNFRPDRAREITRAFVDDDFGGFEREDGRIPLVYICMTQYDITISGVEIAFKPTNLDNTFGEYISKKGLRQLRIAETEKYAHVTFFFNGGVEESYEGEDRALIPSPKVPTYDLKPEMSAFEVTDEVLRRIESDMYDVIILNYANSDMVGHTGDFDAAVKAISAVDECVGKVTDAVIAKGGVILITADHGNSDKMIDEETSSPMTAHTTSPVPLIIAGLGNILLKEEGRLADIAPTMLDILELEKPVEMTGETLIIR